MSKKTCIFVVLLLLLSSLLSACTDNQDTSNTESNAWSSFPQIIFGTLDYEKLTVAKWNSGRCEASSANYMAETENGYYLAYGQILYYADKDQLDTWVPVCNDPSCLHTQENCNAYLRSQFIVRNQRIFFSANPSLYPDLYGSGNLRDALFSRKMDGTDMRLEYANEQLANTGIGYIGSFLTPEHWICSLMDISSDGNYHFQLFRITDEGIETLVDKITADQAGKTGDNMRNYSNIKGESSFSHYYWGPFPYAECRYKDGKPYFVDLSAYLQDGRYLAGNFLRLFRGNDGYYDVDLTTNTETRVAGTFLENVESVIPLPNCVIESTLFYPAPENLPKDTAHAMAIFDGETWRTVELPAELSDSSQVKYLNFRCVTSDSILFTYAESVAVHLYRIPIQDGDLVLEYCGRIK